MESKDVRRHKIWCVVYLIILILLPIVNITCDVIYQKYDSINTVSSDFSIWIIEVLYAAIGLFNVMMTIWLPYEVMYTNYYHEYINVEPPDRQKLLYKETSCCISFLRLFNCYRITYTRAIPWCLYGYLLILPWNMTTLLFTIMTDSWISFMSIVMIISFPSVIVLSFIIFGISTFATRK